MSDIFTSGDFDKYSKYANLDSARGPIIKDIMDKAKEVARRIHEKYEDDKKEPTGNQNCLLCSWCAEALLRDYNILPRPVYSPRDPALGITPEDMLKGSVEKRYFKNFSDMQKWYLDQHNARFYVHVKWKDSNGGHEFLLLNTNVPHVLDAQQGIFSPIVDIKTFKEYFGDIDYNETYMCRIDNHDLDIENLKQINNDSAIVAWDEEKDIQYMRDHDMMSDDDEQYMKDHGMITDKEDFDRVLVPSEEAIKYFKNNKELSSYWEEIAKASEGEFLVTKDTREEIGHVFVHTNKKDKGFIYNVNVEKKFRRKGFGWILVDDAVKKFNGEDLTVDADNTPAVNLYLKYGFKIIDRGYWHNDRKEELWMKYDRSKLKQESFYFHESNDSLIPVEDFKYDTVYYGDPINGGSKRVLNGKPLFVTPFPGVASIFIGRRKLYREFQKQGIHETNLGYKEWGLSENELGEPLTTVHVYVRNQPNLKPFTVEFSGYLHTIDVSDLKNNLYRYPWMSKTRELLIANVSEVKIEKVEKINITYIVRGIAGKEPTDSEVFQEGHFEDRRNGVNPKSKKIFFHVSSKGYLDGQVFKPRVPDYLDEYNPEDTSFENTTTPRVCFSPSIEGCINAIAVNFMRINPIRFEKLYVYIPEKPINEYRHKSNKELIRDKDVYDANVTGEMWILEPVRLKLYGVIRIDQLKKVHRKNTVPTIKNEKDTRPYYSIRWHWLVKPKVVASTEKSQYNYDTSTVCRNLGIDLNKFRYGLIRDGRLITHDNTAEDYEKYWRYHTGEEVDEAGGGNCYDMVEYEGGYLDAYGIPYKKYYLAPTYNDKFSSHTFIVVPNDGKFIYIEKAFEMVSDQFENNKKEFDTLDDIFDFLLENICEYERLTTLNYIIIDYTDIEFKSGTDIKHFRDYILNHGDEVREKKYTLEKKGK
jgi:ribosomal protein S18 acetylase RimI-like enzyme